MRTETEIKLPIDRPEPVRESLRGLGAQIAEPRALEDNFVLDDCGRSLYLRAEVLRVRLTAGRALLTWKGPKTEAEGIKSRPELELGCDDGRSLLGLFARLGFRPVFRYQKYRETWELDGTQVMIDETPVGNFVEIEGEEAGIREVLRRLGMAGAEVAPESYPEMFRRRLVELGDRGDEMVFREG